jgi:hypothetical protein
MTVPLNPGVANSVCGGRKPLLDFLGGGESDVVPPARCGYLDGLGRSACSCDRHDHDGKVDQAEGSDEACRLGLLCSTPVLDAA